MSPVTRVGFIVGLALGVFGCAPTFPVRYDLDALRADSAKWPGEALVHYLSRPRPDLAACDATQLARVDAKLQAPFVEALEEGTTPVTVWTGCAQRLVVTLPPFERAAFVERLAKRVLPLIERADAARLGAVQAVLSSRPPEPAPALQALRAKLPLAVGGELQAPLAALRELLDLEAGALNGRPLTEAVVLGLDDEALLRRIDARAPDEALRVAARRRVIRLHIARATMREVSERAAEVEAALLARGRWAQPVASLPAPAPQPALVLPVDVRLSQDLAGQLVRPFIAGDDSRAPPAIDLRPHLRFSVGWSEPLALCEPADALAVAPCIDAKEVGLGTGFATLDGAGVLHVNAKWAMADAVDFVRAGLGLVVPVKLGDRVTRVLQVPLTAQVPSSYCFEGGLTESGPLVSAVVVPSAQALLVEAVDEKAHRIQFVLPRNAVGFEFGSCGGRGRNGTPGAQGSAGSSGSAGASASCPSTPGGRGGNGGNGGPGGPGRDGGPGGDGGRVRVELHCGSACGDEPLVRAVFRSKGGLGGEGGPGGQGGRGGQGGQGGMGMSCYQNGKSSYASGGSPGSNGSQGAQGPAGRRGAPGRDGVVEIVRR